MPGAPLLTAHGLHKAYGPQTILSDVALSIHEGERLGLVGVNGTGKSTLARILAAAEAPDAGEVVRRRDASVLYLPQEPLLPPEATAREVVTSGLSEWSGARARHEEITEQMGAAGADIDGLVVEQERAAETVERLGGWDHAHRVDAIMHELGLTRPESPIAEMSGGEIRRVALARVLVARPALAILDEPTNHLDVDTIEWLERHLLAEYEGSLLIITHDRYVLDRVVNRTLELDRGTLHSYDGGWEDYLTAKMERIAVEARTEANRQNFLRRELEWLRRQPKARTGKQKARIHRAEAAREAVPEARRERVRGLEVQTTRLGKTVLELRGLTIDVGGQRLVDSLDLTLGRGERVGIVGPNGAGKTSLLRVLLGELAPVAGEVVVGKNTRFAYFDQARSGLDDSLSVLDNVSGDLREVTIGDRTVDVRSWLQGFLFDGDKQRQLVGALSGGERGRVALARMLIQPANVLLLDEPTNDLDVTTLGALEGMLVEMAGTALVVTHDRYFLDRIATSILSFEGGGRVVRYAGSYQAFREGREEARKKDADQARGEARARTPTVAKPAGRPKGGLTYGERIELEGLMERVEAAEGAVAALEAELSDPGIYATRGDEVPALNARLEEARVDVEGLIARWEALESKKI